MRLRIAWPPSCQERIRQRVIGRIAKGLQTFVAESASGQCQEGRDCLSRRQNVLPI